MTYYSVLSWGVTIFLAGAAVYVYRPDLIAKAIPQASPHDEKPVIAERSTGKKQKPKKTHVNKTLAAEDSASGSAGSSTSHANKKRKITAPVDTSVTATTTQGQKRELPRSKDGDMADKEFAQQLARAQEGTKLQSSTQPQKVKTQKQGAAAQSSKTKEVSSLSTEDSSTTGQDADDDMSPADSPDQHPVSGKDINDMLEAPSAKPTSIRLTNISDEPQKPKQANKPFEQVLSKKKRNEQARREEQKKLREESDKIHEAKKQEQLRKARMAEGTSNQSKANAFTSSTNAWKDGPSNTVKSPSGSNAAPLLDTFEPPASAQPANGAVQIEDMSEITSKEPPAASANALKETVGEAKASALAASSREGTSNQNWADEMSEEDQMQKLRDQQHEDAWESVTNKKSKKKGKQEAENSSDTGTALPKTTAPTSVPQANGVKTNGVQKKPESSNRFDTIQTNIASGLQDDEWGA